MGDMVKSFRIPVVAATSSINQAFKATVDAGSSGLLVKTNSGELRLVHYRNLVNAASKGRKLVSTADYVPVLKVGGARRSGTQHKTTLDAAGLTFGYVGSAGGEANMFSVSEAQAGPYLQASSGTRCTRPGKPATMANRDWYHYYPPLARKGAKACRLCKSAFL